MRGVVSLAAALALPLSGVNHSAFPGRELIIFLAFVVIVVTLVVQGLSLPVLIRGLDIRDDRAAEKEEREARLKANQAAMFRLDEIAASRPKDDETVRRLRVEYEDRIRQLQVCRQESNGAAPGLFSSEYDRLSRDTLLVERKTLLALRNEGVINDEVLRRVQQDIDLAEARLGRE
jgi:CPA1 family monovalent cation:H+ antiporter